MYFIVTHKHFVDKAVFKCYSQTEYAVFRFLRGEIMNKMSLSARCSAMFALYYRVFYPAFIMFSSYMVLSGFEADFVARMMTLYGAALIVAKPFFAAFNDKGHCRAIVFSLGAVLLFGTAFFFGSRQKTVFHAVVYAVAVSAVSCVIVETIDSWTLKLSAVYPEIEYGKVRACGSLSFAFIGLIFGTALSKFGLIAAPVAIVIFLFGFLLFAASLPDPKVESTEEKTSFFEGIKEILTDRKILRFIVFYRIGASLIDMTDIYIGVTILEKGGTTAYTGLHDFLKALIEFFVMFAVAKLISRHGTLKIMCIGMVGIFIKTAARALAPTPSLVVATCVTQAISFPLIVGSKMEYIKTNAPKGHIALVVSAVGIAYSLVNTLIINPLMALLIPQMKTRGAMLVMSVFGLVAAIGLWATQREKA